MSVNGLYLDINKGKNLYMPLEIYFYFLCLIKLSPSIIYLLHIKMLYFAFAEFFLFLAGCVVITVRELLGDTMTSIRPSESTFFFKV